MLGCQLSSDQLVDLLPVVSIAFSVFNCLLLYSVQLFVVIYF